MKLVVALGGNALLQRGQALSADNQMVNIRRAAAQLAKVAALHEMVLTHGNGPQVGLLALQGAAYGVVETYPLDVLGAQTDGMLGYLLEQEIANRLPPGRTVVTLLTRVEVDLQDPAFLRPSKPIGPLYDKAEARHLAETRHWAMAADGTSMRRVVASPKPLRIFGLEPIGWLLGHGALVIAAGGGGIPVTSSGDGHSYHGVEAVIDKDLCSALLAQGLQADCLLILTDVAAAYVNFGQPDQRALHKVTPEALTVLDFAAGSMGPKVEAACRFVRGGGARAVIGSIEQIEAMLAGTAGTDVRARHG